MSDLTTGAISTWVNGLPSQHVSVADRGLLYGDGVFETIRVHNGVARFLPLHLQRLGHSCARLAIAPLDLAQIGTEIRAAAAALRSGVAKLIVTRGIGERRGYGASGAGHPTRILSLHADSHTRPATARVAISDVRLGENVLLAGMKHLNRLENVLARSSMPANCDEVLMRSSGGSIVCGSMSNVFGVRQNRLLTPQLNRNGVAGIMRHVVMREAAKLSWQVQEVELTTSDLSGADEVFLTNALVGVWPVTQLEDRLMPLGTLTSRLAATVEALDGSG